MTSPIDMTNFTDEQLGDISSVRRSPTVPALHPKGLSSLTRHPVCDHRQIFELYLGLSRRTMPCEEAADVARIVRPAPPPARAARPAAAQLLTRTACLPRCDRQLGFKAQPAFLSKFGKEEKRRVCLDVHQFVACVSVCHSDHVNHPKSKQIFTLMDHEKKFKNQGAVKTDVLKDENGNEIRQFFAMKVMDKRKLFKFRSIETVI